MSGEPRCHHQLASSRICRRVCSKRIWRLDLSAVAFENHKGGQPLGPESITSAARPRVDANAGRSWGRKDGQGRAVGSVSYRLGAAST
jgi:hypothetical protein